MSNNSPYMSGNRGIGLAQVFLKTDICQRVLAEDGLGVEVGRHEAALALERLVGGQTLHVGRGQEAVEVAHEVGQGRVDADLVLPLELGPHGPELGLSAGGGHDVVHDVDVDVVQHHHVPVARGPGNVINNVAKNNPILC